MSALSDLKAAYDDPHAAARTWKAGGGKVVGLIGSEIPDELVTAAGMLPVRMRSETGASDAPADRYGEGGGNATIRGFIARLLDGTYDYVDHIVVATTPSYLGALFTFLREIQGTDPSFPRLSLQLFDFHHGVGASTVRYNLESLARLRAALEAWSGDPIAEAAIRKAIVTANAGRQRLAELQDLRRDRRVSGTDALRILGAGLTSPRAWFVGRLAGALGDLRGAKRLGGRPVVYSGSETETPDLYRRIEAAGLRIVADDQGWGSRVFERSIDETGDPIVALERRYREMAPAPAKSTTTARVDYLSGLVRRSGATGVVFAVRGLDHPAAWDIPSQIAALDAAGVAHVQLDPSVFAGAPMADTLAPLAREAAHG